jgi:hypothetical protein
MSAPAVAVSTQHKTFAIAWKDMRKGEPNIYWSIAREPNFKSERLVHPITKGEQDHPSLAIDQDGTVWIAWEDTRSGKREVRAKSNRNTDELLISQPDSAPASYPVLASGAGMVAVVFESGKGPQKQIRFRVVDN